MEISKELEDLMSSPSDIKCTCDALSDEHCVLCRNRHKLQGQAVMSYQKTTPLLAVEGVCLSYDRPILKDVNVKIRRIIRDGMHTGRIVSFLGPSGVGKTQLLRILAGLQPASSGGVFLNGDRLPVRAGLVGLVSQQYILYNNRTVMGNLMVAANQLDPKTAVERCNKMLERFGLTEHAHKYPLQLSGGQRQRIAVAQQLLCSDHFLMMDEPTASLDPLAKKKVCQLVLDLANSGDGITVIIVTHDIPFAVSVSDTIWLMGRDRDEAGQVIPHGARIVDSYDLIECGICWNPNNGKHPAYAPLIQELQDRFDTL